MTREITFCHSKQKFKGVPIMASNMDTVGTFEMALALGEVSFLFIRIITNLVHLQYYVRWLIVLLFAHRVLSAHVNESSSSIAKLKVEIKLITMGLFNREQFDWVV
jgi:NADH:ubiquinone oxidoreductase subunit 2 (subunit N)